MTFFISLFILLMQFLWKYIDDLVGKGLEWYIITELLFYASSTFVPMALPLAILLSSLMTFGNLGENYELVAMKAAGISLRRIMLPLIIMSILISGIAFYFSNNVLPIANLKFKSLLYDVREQKLALDIKEGVFYTGLEGFVIRVGKKEKDDKTIREVMIYDHRGKKGNVNLTVADSGRMELTADGLNLVFILYNGFNYLDKTDQKDYKETHPYQRTKFREEIRKFNLVDFELERTNEDLFKSNYSMLNLRQLSHAEDSLIAQVNEKRDHFPKNSLNKYINYNKIDSTKNAEFEPDSIYATEYLAEFKDYEKASIIEEATKRIRRSRQSLQNYKLDLNSKKKLIYRHQVEWHRKFTLSFACFVLFFIGASAWRNYPSWWAWITSCCFSAFFHSISHYIYHR